MPFRKSKLINVGIVLGIMAMLAAIVWAGTPQRSKYGIRFRDEGAAHDRPPSGYGDVYVNSDKLYFITDGGVATDLAAASSTAADFELTSDADAGDFDIDSLDRLEFYDSGLYIDGGTDSTLIISSDGTLEIATSDWDISTTGTITGASISADQVSAGNLTIGNSYLSIGTDPADAGSIRLPNAGSILFENSTPGADVDALNVDASEVVQIGASGASGVTITPAVTMSGALTIGGTLTVAANAISGTTGTVTYTEWSIDADGNITTTGDLTVSGAIVQDAWVASGAGPTNMTIDAVGSGTITIAGTSTGAINLGDDSGGATSVVVGDGTDMTIGEGKLTIDNDANEDALVITSSATTESAIELTAAATTTGKTISVTADNLGTAGVMLYLDSDNIADDNYFIALYDGSGVYDFSVSQYGATVIEGSAVGTDSLTLTAGDITLISGHIRLTNGHIAIGSAAVQTWETSTDMQALQVGGGGFFGASTVQAASDSSYIGHNAYFDDTDNRWEAVSTNANDEATMLQMTDGTYIFNVEDTEIAANAAITWIPALVIKDTGEIGIGTATAAATDELLHVQSSSASEPVLKLENTASDATSPILMSLNDDGSANSDGDDLFLLQVGGYDTGSEVLDAIIIQAAADWGDSGTDTPTEILFYTVPDASQTEALVLTLGSDRVATFTGDIAVNSATSEKPLITITNTNTDANGAVLHIVKNGDDEADDDEVAEIRFSGDDDGDAETIMGSIRALSSDVTNAAESGQIDIYAMVNGTERNLVSVGGEDTANSAPTEIVINEDSIDADFRVESDNLDDALYVQGNDGRIGLGVDAPVTDLDVVGHISARKYYWVDEFDTGNAGDAVDEVGAHEAFWTVGGTNESDMVNFANGIGGTVTLATASSGDNDSTFLIGEPVIAESANVIFEARLKIDDITNVHWVVGLVEESYVDRDTFDDDIMLIGQDTDTVAANVYLITNDANGGAVLGDTGINAANGAYLVVRGEFSDKEQPRVWINNTEILSGIDSNTIAAGTTLMPYVMVQNVSGGAQVRTLTIDYFKIWQDRG